MQINTNNIFLIAEEKGWTTKTLSHILKNTIEHFNLNEQFNFYLSNLEEVLMDNEIDTEDLDFEILAEHFDWNENSMSALYNDFLLEQENIAEIFNFIQKQ